MANLTPELTERATAIFGTTAGIVRWPYGLQDVARHAPRAAAARETPRIIYARQTIVEWAERYGLKATTIGCCPHWLLRPTSRRCKTGACRNRGGLDYVWLDHPIGWLKDSRPAVLTSAPYSPGAANDPGIAEWLTKDVRLRATHGPGWYGGGTTQIVLWRTDRIDTVTAAGVATDPVWGDIPAPPRTDGRTTPCRHCGTLCANPDSPDFLSTSGCGGLYVPDC